MIVYKKIFEFIENKERSQYCQMIDYTKISSLTNDQIKAVCKEAETNNFYSVCLLPEYVATAKSFLENVKISALIDFPKGEKKAKDKISEIDQAIINGANEIDVVVNYNLIKDSEEHEELKTEIREVVEYCHREGIIAKIIIEIGALNYQELESICRMCSDSNADFIMTSTGKLPNDNSFEVKVEKVKYMRKVLPEEMKIKFSGGIRTFDQIKEITSFVDRVATSVVPT